MLPAGYRLWVFRVYDDGRFFPLRPCIVSSGNDQWEAPNCDVGGKSGDSRSFSVNIVGQDGEALITYVRDAHDRFKPIRDRLVSTSGSTDVPYMPSVDTRTKDIIQCALVRVERA